MIAVLVIGVVFLLFKLFGGKSSVTDQDLIKQLIASKDSIIEVYKDNVALSERLIEEKEKTNSALQDRDSVLNVHYNETEKLYKDINAKINSIPGRIARISGNNDSLRLLLATY